MSRFSKPQLAVYAAFAVAVVLIGARFLRASGGDAGSGGAGDVAALTARQFGLGGASAGGAGGASTAASGRTTAAGSTRAASPDGAEPPPDTPDGRLVVDVKGAVRRPGVYRLAAGARAIDAVRRAGGLARGADRVGVNLAARVVDGGEVVVPGRGVAADAANGAGAGAGNPGADGVGPGGAAASAGPLSLDLNTASEQQLEQLDGVGPATAAKIVAYRTQHGGISSVDQLDEVPGIGPAKLAAIRAQLGR
jgi:competence protein ComEA